MLPPALPSLSVVSLDLFLAFCQPLDAGVDTFKVSGQCMACVGSLLVQSFRSRPLTYPWHSSAHSRCKVPDAASSTLPHWCSGAFTALFGLPSYLQGCAAQRDQQQLHSNLCPGRACLSPSRPDKEGSGRVGLQMRTKHFSSSESSKRLVANYIRATMQVRIQVPGWSQSSCRQRPSTPWFCSLATPDKCTAWQGLLFPSSLRLPSLQVSIASWSLSHSCAKLSHDRTASRRAAGLGPHLSLAHPLRFRLRSCTHPQTSPDPQTATMLGCAGSMALAWGNGGPISVCPALS